MKRITLIGRRTNWTPLAAVLADPHVSVRIFPTPAPALAAAVADETDVFVIDSEDDPASVEHFIRRMTAMRPAAPVVVAADHRDPARLAFIEAGAALLLRTPVDALELVAAVQSALAGAARPQVAHLLDQLPAKLALVHPDGTIALANRAAAGFWRSHAQGELHLGLADGSSIEALAAQPSVDRAYQTGRLRLAGLQGQPRDHLVVVANAPGMADQATLRAVLAIPDDGRETAQRPPAFEDALTGLATLIGRASRSGRVAALHLVHIAGLADINRTFGIIVGNGLVDAVSARLTTLAAEAKLTVARVTGNEFALLQIAPDMTAVEALARRVAAVVNDVVIFAGQQLEADARVGVACFPQDGAEPGALIGAATASVLHARLGAGADGVVFASPRGETVAKPDLGQALRQALEEDALSFHYQPQVNFRTGRYDGVEALLRWSRGDAGEVAPTEVIALAERDGCLPALTGWAAARLGREHRRLVQSAGAPLRLSLHLSAAQLGLPDLGRLLLPLLEQGVGPVELILAARTVADDTPHCRATLQALSDLGFGLCLSLSENDALPDPSLAVDRIKIDARNEMALQRLRLPGDGTRPAVTGANVEEATQLVALRAAGCVGAQGYYIQPPVSLMEMIAALRTGL